MEGKKKEKKERREEEKIENERERSDQNSINNPQRHDSPPYPVAPRIIIVEWQTPPP